MKDLNLIRTASGDADEEDPSATKVKTHNRTGENNICSGLDKNLIVQVPVI